MSVDINWSIITSSSSSSTGNTSTSTSTSTNTTNNYSEGGNNSSLDDNSRDEQQQQQQQQQREEEKVQDEPLAESVRTFLDARFQQITLPPFLNAVRVTAFDFGDVPPEIEVRDVCEPLGEFYDDDDDDDDNNINDGGEDDRVNELKGDGIREERVAGTTVSKDNKLNNAVAKSDARAGFDATDAASATNTSTAGEGITTAAINRLNLSNLKLPLSSSSSSAAAAAGTQLLPSPFNDFHFPGAGASGLNTPQLSVAGTHTPGIPGGASNLGYFHLPLSAGLSGTVPGSMGPTTPMMAVAGIGMGMGAGAGSTWNAEGSKQRRGEGESLVHQNLQQQHRRQKQQRREDKRGDIGEQSTSAESKTRRISPGRSERRRKDGTVRVTSNKEIGRYRNYSDSSSSRSSNSSDSDDSAYRNRGRGRRRRGRHSVSSHYSISSSNISTSSIPAPYQPSPNDVQIVAHVRYSGNVRVSLTAEILLDYPMPSFVSIPLKLNITGLVFDGTAVLAYVQKQLRQQVRRQQRRNKRGSSVKGCKMGEEDRGKMDDSREEDSESKRVHFCFLAPEDTQALYPAAASLDPVDGLPGDVGENSNGDDKNNHDRHTTSGYPNRAAGGKTINASPIFTSTTQNHNTVQVKDSDNNSPLHALRIESEIGQGENGKQVLKNVGKVERFVLEQVRRVFEEELVFPSYWTFLV